MAIQPLKLFAKPEAHFFRRIVHLMHFFPAAPYLTNVLFVLRERLRVKFKQRLGIIHNPANSPIHQLKENWLRNIARALAGPAHIFGYFLGIDIIFLKVILGYPLANRKKVFEYLALTIQL
ncbi:hypothetical protein B8W76_06200 [Pseudomonas aeruginosa]|nr:hypothetical protein AO977_31870 [Pseudomonas aeruginosa]OKR21378.1 hypothetical protein BH592_26135 [Pseudomonas aeruginosa]OUM37181.1 hypothetical protein B8W76_06200 [Pseudomonas aeruginosa]OWJ25407.1 hypothetical protein CDC06_27845 [Pseudomonas aeruginosa]PBX07038.1 hypothetical protein CJT87_05430 [Pseudomonas aeruginosa]